MSTFKSFNLAILRIYLFIDSYVRRINVHVSCRKELFKYISYSICKGDIYIFLSLHVFVIIVTAN